MASSPFPGRFFNTSSHRPSPSTFPHSVPPSTDATKAKELLQAASSGNLRALKEVARELSKGEGKGVAETIKGVMDERGYGAFHLAALDGKLEVCEYFVEELGFHVDLLSAKGETPLFHAAMGGRLAIARYLISRGADPVASDIEGLTPLHYAARHGRDELVIYLLSLGVPADIECNHATGTPLTVAAMSGEASTMKILLEHHVDVNRAANNDYTPLLLAVHIGSLKCTKLLAEAGADLNLSYPLEMAIHKESTEIIKYLLDAGADPNIRNEYGSLPIEIAAASNKVDIVDMLFPMTSPFPEVHDWSLQGILRYGKSKAYMEKTNRMMKKNLADLKVKGADALKRNEFLAAICFYTKAIAIDKIVGSLDATLFTNRSMCWHRMGAGDRALQDALEARSLKPNWPKAYYRMGSALMLLKDYDQASQAFMDALRLDPGNEDIKNALRRALDCMRESAGGRSE